MQRLLEVHGLTVRYGQVVAVENAGFEIAAGEAVGVLGESGCGKTTIALSVLGLRAASGSVRFRGIELIGLPERQLQEVRGAGIALIPQEPALALNPVMRAGEQVMEVLRAHRRPDPRGRAESVLARLFQTDVERIRRSYPHQLSGGERQRVAIAQALALEPALIVADEPASALDAALHAEIFALLRELQDRCGTALLLITHNPASLEGLASRVLVVYAGRIVEQGAHVLTAPRHPYTRALLACVPGGRKPPLPSIPGSPPDMARLGPGCPFAPRCAERIAECAQRAEGCHAA